MTPAGSWNAEKQVKAFFLYVFRITFTASLLAIIAGGGRSGSSATEERQELRMGKDQRLAREAGIGLDVKVYTPTVPYSLCKYLFTKILNIPLNLRNFPFMCCC